jgi:hypothetical protein
LDGKPSQAIERGDVTVEALSDRELFAIIRGEGPLTVVYDPSAAVNLKGG